MHGKLLPYEKYVSDTQAGISQGLIRSSGKEAPPPAYVKDEVTEMAMTPNEGNFEPTGTAVRVTKFEVAHYPNQELRVKVY